MNHEQHMRAELAKLGLREDEIETIINGVGTELALPAYKDNLYHRPRIQLNWHRDYKLAAIPTGSTWPDVEVIPLVELTLLEKADAQPPAHP